MKFLLINTNKPVEKIFSLAARKANINLDIINSMQEIRFDEDYACIFIDDGALQEANFQSLKNKMLTTKFCLILAKDKEMPKGFDSYIRKPFLPTDIYEVLKKEKYNDMNFSPYNNVASTQKSSNNDIIDIKQNPTNNTPNNINNNGLNNIDFNEFSDSDDEFLTRPQETINPNDIQLKLDDNKSNTIQPIPARNSTREPINTPIPTLDTNLPEANPIENFNHEHDNNNEIRFTYDDNEDDEQHHDIGINAYNPINASSNLNDEIPLNLPETNDIESKTMIEPIVEQSPIIDTMAKSPTIENPAIESIENTTIAQEATFSETNLAQATPQNEPQQHQYNNSDEIDFSSIFAMQDEFLQAQEQKKGLIGGDIYTKKEDTSTPPPTKAKLKDTTKEESKPSTLHDFDDLNEYENLGLDNFDLPNTQNNNNATKQDSTPQDSTQTPPNITPNETISQSNLGNTININTNPPTPPIITKNINELSDEELDELDDETLLSLQEESINHTQNSQNTQNLNATQNPQILKKDDIDEVHHILNTTQEYNQTNNITIENNELNSLTHEALSEVLDEGNIDRVDDFSLDGLSGYNNANQAPNMQSFDIPQSSTNTPPIEPNLTSQPQQNLADTQINMASTPNNVNLDLTEIIKSFPVDKLRELLSGVQITINITFPTKNK